jgi:hypothetical protein
MKIKTLIFLLSLAFLFLFSGSSAAGLFSPDDWTECVFKNANKLSNEVSAKSTFLACQSKFPQKPIKGPSGMFGPKNYDDCILKYGNEVTSLSGSKLIIIACAVKFKKFKDKEKKSAVTNSPMKKDLKSTPRKEVIKPTPKNEKKYFYSGFGETENVN